MIHVIEAKGNRKNIFLDDILFKELISADAEIVRLGQHAILLSVMMKFSETQAFGHHRAGLDQS